MKILQPALLAIVTSSVVVEAAPTQIYENETSSLRFKREILEDSLLQFMELRSMRAKREEMSTELVAREYAIVTNVLTAIKDTDLAPTVLKFFVENKTLSSIAIDGVVLIVKSNAISAKSLLSLLVQSGLITSVLNDILGDCQVYASLISSAETILQNLFKREMGHDSSQVITPEKGLEMLRRDEHLFPSGFYDVNVQSLHTRDFDDVVVNLLESLASSGLGTQVVETVLTDTEFLSFGAKLIQTLYADQLISLSALVAAVSESGIIPELLKEILNFSTLEKIAKTAISAATGKCSSGSGIVSSAPTKTVTPSSSGKPSASQIVATSSSSSLRGIGILSGVSGFLDSFFGDGDSTKPASTVATSTRSTATAPATSPYACSTPSQIGQRKRMRLY